MTHPLTPALFHGALEVEVVGRDVGQDARVVRLVADAAQDDPPASGLEHRDVNVRAAQDLEGASRPGPVAGVRLKQAGWV